MKISLSDGFFDIHRRLIASRNFWALFHALNKLYKSETHRYKHPSHHFQRSAIWSWEKKSRTNFDVLLVKAAVLESDRKYFYTANQINFFVVKLNCMRRSRWYAWVRFYCRKIRWNNSFSKIYKQRRLRRSTERESFRKNETQISTFLSLCQELLTGNRQESRYFEN